MHIILIFVAIFACLPVVSPPVLACVPKVADPYSIELIDLCLCAAEVMLYRRTRGVRFPVSDAFSGFCSLLFGSGLLLAATVHVKEKCWVQNKLSSVHSICDMQSMQSYHVK